MKNIIITGSTGMVGSAALKKCLARKDVGKVTSIVRRSSGITHPKLTEVIHDSFEDFSGISEYLKDQDGCVYCIGIYTGQVPDDEFCKITVDYTKAFASELKKQSPDVTFCFLSGMGADRNEKARAIFAREKGKAENYLIGLGFDKLRIFRPGYIYPVEPRKEPNFSYKLMRVMYKPFFSHFKSLSVTSHRLAAVMVDAAVTGRGQETMENNDIMAYGRKRRAKK